MPATKYDVELESFFDLHFFYPISEFLMPIFRSLSFTPNLITTLSFFTLAVATYFLFIDTRIAAIFAIISYAFDCSDGMFARRYNMCSPFGMAYDYTKDAVMNTTFLLAFLYRYISFYNLNIWIVLPSLLVFAYFCLVWLGISEATVHYKKYHDTDYYIHREKQFKKKTLGASIYLGLSKFFLDFLARPYIKDPDKMNIYAQRLKLFGLGNAVMLCFIIMNIWVIA
jgi:phosphatidylglycerophosphate synthase